ncbi:sialidase family protein [Ruficoccus sp. ZRK36]|uniref:sialidase family protein n=1 Tax=Ruficoccus sp. ZRK36 TaxID=2866311 RepID=UPI001C7368D2|nr:sialidase family protein [Ruficoccus sp. ZRK36]QYY35029.1 glycoside hydrolase [Ruficoccus sp. ZRK36]
MSMETEQKTQPGSVTTLPGTVINHLPSEGKQYIGSPSLAVLPDGSYVASHDVFGPSTTEMEEGHTFIYRSDDRGESWEQIATIKPAFWSNLFVHNGALYLMGTTHHHGLIVVRRSDDGGHTWTLPEDTQTGIITPYGQYHTAPMPMLVHRGRIWRSIEDATASTRWGVRYNPLIMSAPLGADLLRQDSWSFSSIYRQNAAWLDNGFGGWLEGNVLALPDGSVANLLRVDVDAGGVAAMVTLDTDGHSLTFDPEKDFVELPGGATKFSIRQDPLEGGYWSLANAVPERHAKDLPRHTFIRNTLALLYSADARHWETRAIVLYHPDSKRHGFQYVDWLFDGDDLIVASRTSWDDPTGGAPNQHDANFLTFHRIPDFRTAGAGLDLEQQMAALSPTGGSQL